MQIFFLEIVSQPVIAQMAESVKLFTYLTFSLTIMNKSTAMTKSFISTKRYQLQSLLHICRL